MKNDFRDALLDYAKTIKQNGWRAGEPLIEKYKRRFKDFDKWAAAIGIMLRADELLKA